MVIKLPDSPRSKHPSIKTDTQSSSRKEKADIGDAKALLNLKFSSHSITIEPQRMVKRTNRIEIGRHA